MKFTIIPDDGAVAVDGRLIRGLDLSGLPAIVHAVHWYGESGEVEVRNASGRVIENVAITGYEAYQAALDAWETARQALDAPPPEPQPLTQREKDELRYQRRAAVKDQLLAYMAADNMGRVRSGTWTVANLTSLMDDPAVVAANAYMSTLSFELASSSINAAATPLLTPEIKADWTAKLAQHYYLDAP